MTQIKANIFNENKHYQDLYEYSNDAIIIHSLEGEIFMTNPHAGVMFGWTEEELMTFNFFNQFSVKGELEINNLRKKLIEEGSERIHCNLIKADQTTFNVEISFTLMNITNTNVVQAIIRDVTFGEETLKVLKKTNEALNRSKKDLTEVHKRAHIGNWEYDVATNSITWSDEIYRIFELNPNEFEANYEAFLASIHRDDVKRVNMAYMTSMTRKESYHESFRLITSKGIKYVEDRCEHILDKEGNIARSIGLIQDVSELVKKDEQIKHQEEMIIVQSRHAAMGEMIGMIAHQWRQPISIVGLLTEAVQKHLLEDTINFDEVEEDLEVISNQVHYMSNTIEDFKNFFQKSNKIDKVELNTLLNEIKTMLGAVLKRHDIELKITCNTSIFLHTYSRELLQVLMNIVTNAKDVLEKKVGLKEIVITTSQEQEEVQIKIFNNGSFIDDAIKYKIFEPYFTTKSNSGGTGLGLYMVKTIIDKHIQGKISVENVADGVEFSITLPERLDIEE